MSAWIYDDFVAWLWFTPIVCLIGLLVLCLKTSAYRKRFIYFYYTAILILATLVVAVFIRNQIYFEDHVERANRYYVNASLFNTPLQRQLVSEMNHSKRKTNVSIGVLMNKITHRCINSLKVQVYIQVFFIITF